MVRFRNLPLWLVPALLVTPLLAAGPGRGNRVFADNFNDGNDDGWLPQTTFPGGFLPPGADATFDASGGSYTVAIDSIPPDSGAQVSSFIDGAFDANNATVRLKVRFDTPDTSVIWVARDTASNATIEFFMGAGFQFISIFEFDDNESLFENGSFEFVAGVDYQVEFTMHGAHHTLKVWVDGEAEPNLPQLSLNGLTGRGGMVMGLSVLGVSEAGLSATFDDVLVTRGGN